MVVMETSNGNFLHRNRWHKCLFPVSFLEPLSPLCSRIIAVQGRQDSGNETGLIHSVNFTRSASKQKEVEREGKKKKRDFREGIQ